MLPSADVAGAFKNGMAAYVAGTTGNEQITPCQCRKFLLQLICDEFEIRIDYRSCICHIDVTFFCLFSIR